MANINENYLKLKAGYLFPEISKRVNEHSQNNPNKKIIRMGIGDVTQPLAPSIIKAFHEGVEEMAYAKTFKGYGPEQGYEFLRELIVENDFKNLGILTDEIFVSDGSKCDCGNIQEIFGKDNIIAICDPVYPVYIDSNVMAGNTGECNSFGYYDKIFYLPCLEENNFLPKIPKTKVDIIYLCFPNNPTGTTPTKEYLQQWVEYAIQNKAIILYDAAYEAFIIEKDIPHSIYEIEGAKNVAIEFRSYSKTAGFTGTRCAFTVIPKELKAFDHKGCAYSLNPIWSRRHCTKFNGVSYPVQKAAASIYSKEGKKEVKAIINYYLENAKIMRESLKASGYIVFGGINAPYIWVKTKNNMTSWEFFDFLLDKAGVVGTPGSGFGPSGENYFRFSAFAKRDNVIEAMEKIKNL